MIHNSVYKSLLYHMSQTVPSGVFVVEGESYGVRKIEPGVKSPSVTVTLGDTSSYDLELGSDSISFKVVYTIHAKSRLQRDALKDVVYSGVVKNPIQVYTTFSGHVPVMGSLSQRKGQLGDYIKIVDVPKFDTDREQFFWTSVVYADFVLA